MATAAERRAAAERAQAETPPAEQPAESLTPVELEHPDVEGTFTCRPRAVKHWTARGWKPVDAKAAEAAIEAAGAAEQES